MKIVFTFILLFVVFSIFSYAGQLADCGNLPTWDDLHMTKKDYWDSMAFLGTVCGSIFTFLITR